MSKASMQDFLGIKLVKVERGYMEATMPVNERTKQPFGYLHGGANVVLAETVASLGSYELIDQTTELCFGLEINANHLRSKQDVLLQQKLLFLHKEKPFMFGIFGFLMRQITCCVFQDAA